MLFFYLFPQFLVFSQVRFFFLVWFCFSSLLGSPLIFSCYLFLIHSRDVTKRFQLNSLLKLCSTGFCLNHFWMCNFLICPVINPFYLLRFFPRSFRRLSVTLSHVQLWEQLLFWVIQFLFFRNYVASYRRYFVVTTKEWGGLQRCYYHERCSLWNR